MPEGKTNNVNNIASIKIKLLSAQAMERAQRKWDSIAKPLDGLGIFEDITVRLAGIYGTEDFDIDKRCVLVMCADNGVVCEGVTQTGQEVTRAVSENIAAGRASVCRMAGLAGAEVFAYDVGINGECDYTYLINKKIAKGTKNIAKEPAMTREEALKAIDVGMEAVRTALDKGYKIAVTGEMGIGNTTTSAALLSAFLDIPPEETVGRGAGLSDDGLKKKLAAVSSALKMHGGGNALEVLRCLGGFDIAALAGVFIGGAAYGMPVVIDGIITLAAAVCACEIVPGTEKYMIASHVSGEPAAEAALLRLGLDAPIRAGMRLGEGTGGVCMLPLLDMAMEVYSEGCTFEETDIEAYEKY